MTTNAKRRDPDQDHGAQNIGNVIDFIPHQSGIVNSKRAARLARRLKRTEGKLSRLTCERERLAVELAGMGGAA